MSSPAQVRKSSVTELCRGFDLNVAILGAVRCRYFRNGVNASRVRSLTSCCCCFCFCYWWWWWWAKHISSARWCYRAYRATVVQLPGVQRQTAVRAWRQNSHLSWWRRQPRRLCNWVERRRDVVGTRTTPSRDIIHFSPAARVGSRTWLRVHSAARNESDKRRAARHRGVNNDACATGRFYHRVTSPPHVIRTQSRLRPAWDVIIIVIRQHACNIGDTFSSVIPNIAPYILLSFYPSAW